MANIEKNFEWDAEAFFRNLVETNRLAQDKGYRFATVSGAEGLEEYIETVKATTCAVCLSEESPGVVSLNNTPHTRRVKTVFLMKRHKLNDMEARKKCLAEMRELFRQFMSVVFKQRTQIEQGLIYFDERVQFTEIERYFAAGAACAYFQIAYNVYTDLRYNPDEWLS